MKVEELKEQLLKDLEKVKEQALRIQGALAACEELLKEEMNGKNTET